MLEFLFGSKSPVKLKLYLKFNLFKCPALRLTHERWSRGKTDPDKIFFFFLPLGLKKRKEKVFLTDVGRRPSMYGGNYSCLPPPWQRGSWNYRRRGKSKMMTKNLIIKGQKQEENNCLQKKDISRC